MLSVTKTDKLNAKLISMYGEKMNPPYYKMPSSTFQILRQQRTFMRQLKKQLHMVKNMEESLDALPFRDIQLRVNRIHFLFILWKYFFNMFQNCPAYNLRSN